MRPTFAPSESSFPAGRVDARPQLEAQAKADEHGKFALLIVDQPESEATRRLTDNVDLVEGFNLVPSTPLLAALEVSG